MLKRSLFLGLSICFLLISLEKIYAEGNYNIYEEFDAIAGIYIEKIGERTEFLSSIPQGAVVADGAYFDVPSDVNVELLRDGTEMVFNNKTPIVFSGYYIMKLSHNGETGVFTFRISDPPKGKIATNEYKYPKIICQGDISLDSQEGLYKYTLPNYKAFYSSVSGYGQTVESAKFIVPKNLGYSLKLNGETIPLLNNKIYTKSGNYSLKIYGYSYASTRGYEASYETELKFNISYPKNDEKDVWENIEIQEKIAEPIEIKNDENIKIDDVLAEQFFEEIGVYSETFSNGDAFYTNTPNEGIVGGNVYLDLPYNMEVKMTKDGIEEEFKNKEYINDEGIYSLIITDYYDEKNAKARFAFKIQKGSPMSLKVEEGEKEKEDIAEESVIKSGNYDAEKEMYYYSVGEERFYCSVADGMISNEAVKTEISPSFEYTLLKDDEDIEYQEELSESGRYELTVKDGNQNETIISFYIVDKYAGFIEQFIVPEGYEALVGFNDIYGKENEGAISPLKMASEGQAYDFTLDGEYNILLKSTMEMPDKKILLVIDRVGPELTFDGFDKEMSAKGTSVDLKCDEENVKIIIIRGKDEEEIKLENGKATISGKGKYKVIARDLAGNETEYTFILGRNDTLGYALIFVFLLIIVGGALLALFKMGILKMPSFNAHKSKINVRGDMGNSTKAEDLESNEEKINYENNDFDDWEDE